MVRTVTSEGSGSPAVRHSMLFLALLSVAGALWRALVAVHHYRSSLMVADDLSIEELERVSAFLEGGFSLLLLIHGAAFFALSRRRLVIEWRYSVAVALVCTGMVSGSLLGVPLITVPGVYPITIVVSASILSHYLVFNWLSLYLGAVVGSAIGWSIGAPLTDAFVALSVVGPCVALVFLGAGLRLLCLHILATADSS